MQMKSINQKKHATSKEFKLTLKNSGSLLTFTWPNDTNDWVVVSEILSLNESELILGFGNERTSKFRKINMP